jgi:hypothetical protein
LRLVVCAVVPVFFLLAGCGRGVGAISSVAESVRASAEHVGGRERSDSDAREAQIITQAVEIENKADADALQESNQTAHYEVRQEGGAWAVYDLTTGQMARVGLKSQSKLTRSQADQAAFDMQAQENESQMRAAAASGHPARSH